MRRALANLIVGMALLASTSVTARAGQLTTGRVERDSAGTQQGLRCTGTNVGKKPISSMTTVFVTPGGEVASNLCTDLSPGGTCASADETVSGASCKMTFTGSARNVRGNLYVYEISSGGVVAIEPAR